MFALALPADALAQGCEARAPVSADGRMLGHLPYGEAAAADLISAPDGFGLRGGCRIRREVLADLQRLLAAASADPSTRGTLRAVSCHRGIAWQQSVFCREFNPNAADRAISVAPPGHSEHSTGYAIDFAIRPSPNCPDAEACMAALPAAKWLRINAPRYGFEQSFPGGNKQGVKWEPWHWRWVGTSATAPGAARARFLFARARRDFPAEPAVD
ncbi:D-alanyl-D-alanine carboxypeptidase [Sphingomonas gellani]|uniref:D-alanyl-D-alanine carboxypeptidase n=2 Tax=Sphingomonas gellani TaxID=1166340 RepID=A0A1H8FT17_9SPHN|nr:D-alanyl-D-alanine carboxypeptidase [Sphingomonas gellani]